MRLHTKIFIGAAVICMLGLFSFTTRLTDRYFEIVKNLDIFTTLYKELNTYYVDEVSPTKLMNIGVEAMLESLDPYTNYIPEERIEDYRIMSTGQYGGIGTAMGKFDGRNVVLMAFDGSPAAEGGVKIGDEIIAIDGIDITDKSTDEINTLLKGQIGTGLSITVQRLSSKKPIKIDLKRERISIESVPYYGMVNDDIAYIRLSEFTAGAGSEVRSALISLKEKGATKVILDLRGNPGGLLDQAIDVSNIFIPKGKEVVSTKGKIEEWNKTYTANKNPVDIHIPIAVLTSSGSASASEIVAGVMQDYDRGVLIGQKSYGKGLVQATRPLSYNSQLKLTTAKYYIPSGRCIQAIDYSNRNDDGSVGKIPDSLKSEFKTAKGRIVYDGGGVTPDVEVEDYQYAPVTMNLILKGYIFDYATKYYYEHLNNVPDAKRYHVSDAEYADFKKWLNDREYSYKTRMEKELSEFEEAAKKEKFYELVKQELDNLKTEVEEKKSNDLDMFEEEIKRALTEEIIGRFHKRQGMIEASFESDAEVEKAIEVLSDQERYKALLAPTN